MKFYSIKSIILVSALILFGGCIGDLDVMPLDPNVMTAEDAYSTPESYTQGLKKIYSVWALSGQKDAGSSDLSDLMPVTQYSCVVGGHCKKVLQTK